MIDEIMKLRALVDESVRENMCEGILLSGGLDTSILATVASKYNPNLRAFTVAFGEAPDLEYSMKLAKQLNLKHHILTLTEKNLMANIKPTIEILHSFDPMEIRNSVAIYSGLKFAREYVSSIMTGDGGDELFAGYSFLKTMSKKELVEYSRRLYEIMHFSSTDLGRALEVQVRVPYLSQNIMSFAFVLNPDLKIRQGVGKWILRKAFENDLPAEFVWREKTPIESGSGTVILPKFFNEKISDGEFHKKMKICLNDGVKIRDKEHLYYYEIYRDAFGEIPSSKEGEIECRGCGGGLLLNTLHCRICGTTNDEMG